MTVVGALSVSHAPGILGWPDDVTDVEHKSVFEAFDDLKETADQLKRIREILQQAAKDIESV